MSSTFLTHPLFCDFVCNFIFLALYVKYVHMKAFFLSIFQYIGHANVSESSEPCDAKVAVKKRKLSSETTENLEEAVINEHTDASESTGQYQICLISSGAWMMTQLPICYFLILCIIWGHNRLHR